MMSWKFKAAVQNALSLLPAPQRWNHFFQTYVTRPLELSEDLFRCKWAVCERHVAVARRWRDGVEGARVIELGTGWFPIIPVGLALSGARAVWSVDVEDLLTRRSVVATLRQYHQLLGDGRVNPSCAHAKRRIAAVLERAGRLDAHEMLAELGITYLVADARAIDLPAGSIDLFVSNNTFEHVPRHVLTGILREFRRLAAPGALSSHHIDMVDHYANFDRSISIYNFIRYSERDWRRYNNPLHYQNRLRVSDFRALHQDCGWQVLEEDSARKSSEVLRGLPLAPEFRRYDEADLLVYESWISSRAV